MYTENKIILNQCVHSLVPILFCMLRSSVGAAFQPSFTVGHRFAVFATSAASFAVVRDKKKIEVKSLLLQRLNSKIEV